MADTQWSDISEFQTFPNASYPYQILCIRSNDGSYLDQHFVENLTWCKAAVAAGKLVGYIVYYFYRPGVDGAAVLRTRVGAPDARMSVMVDMEAAGGQVHGDQSPWANQQVGELVAWMGGDSRRVIGYGNPGDLNALWPNKPSSTFKLVIAAYGSNPAYPNKFAHQYADNANTAPFGPSDINSADGMDIATVQATLGWSGAPIPHPPPTPAPPPPPPHPTPIPPAHRNPYTPLTVDGAFGPKTVQAQQFVDFNGDLTQCDGNFGPNSKKAMQAHLGVAQDGVIGPQTVSALQRHCGVTPVDGNWGPQTTRGLQTCLNVGSY
jgi:hypothetical protein